MAECETGLKEKLDLWLEPLTSDTAKLVQQQGHAPCIKAGTSIKKSVQSILDHYGSRFSGSSAGQEPSKALCLVLHGKTADGNTVTWGPQVPKSLKVKDVFNQLGQPKKLVLQYQLVPAAQKANTACTQHVAAAGVARAAAPPMPANSGPAGAHAQPSIPSQAPNVAGSAYIPALPVNHMSHEPCAPSVQYQGQQLMQQPLSTSYPQQQQQIHSAVGNAGAPDVHGGQPGGVQAWSTTLQQQQHILQLPQQVPLTTQQVQTRQTVSLQQLPPVSMPMSFMDACGFVPGQQLLEQPQQNHMQTQSACPQQQQPSSSTSSGVAQGLDLMSIIAAAAAEAEALAKQQQPRQPVMPHTLPNQSLPLPAAAVGATSIQPAPCAAMQPVAIQSNNNTQVLVKSAVRVSEPPTSQPDVVVPAVVPLQSAQQLQQPQAATQSAFAVHTQLPVIQQQQQPPVEATPSGVVSGLHRMVCQLENAKLESASLKAVPHEEPSYVMGSSGHHESQQPACQHTPSAAADQCLQRAASMPAPPSAQSRFLSTAAQDGKGRQYNQGEQHQEPRDDAVVLVVGGAEKNMSGAEQLAHQAKEQPHQPQGEPQMSNKVERALSEASTRAHSVGGTQGVAGCSSHGASHAIDVPPRLQAVLARTTSHPESQPGCRPVLKAIDANTLQQQQQQMNQKAAPKRPAGQDGGGDGSHEAESSMSVSSNGRVRASVARPPLHTVHAGTDMTDGSSQHAWSTARHSLVEPQASAGRAAAMSVAEAQPHHEQLHAMSDRVQPVGQAERGGREGMEVEQQRQQQGDVADHVRPARTDQQVNNTRGVTAAQHWQQQQQRQQPQRQLAELPQPHAQPVEAAAIIPAAAPHAPHQAAAQADMEHAQQHHNDRAMPPPAPRRHRPEQHQHQHQRVLHLPAAQQGGAGAPVAMLMGSPPPPAGGARRMMMLDIDMEDLPSPITPGTPTPSRHGSKHKPRRLAMILSPLTPAKRSSAGSPSKHEVVRALYKDDEECREQQEGRMESAANANNHVQDQQRDTHHATTQAEPQHQGQQEHAAHVQVADVHDDPMIISPFLARPVSMRPRHDVPHQHGTATVSGSANVNACSTHDDALKDRQPDRKEFVCAPTRRIQPEAVQDSHKPLQSRPSHESQRDTGTSAAMPKELPDKLAPVTQKPSTGIAPTAAAATAATGGGSNSAGVVVPAPRRRIRAQRIGPVPSSSSLLSGLSGHNMNSRHSDGASLLTTSNTTGNAHGIRFMGMNQQAEKHFWGFAKASGNAARQQQQQPQQQQVLASTSPAAESQAVADDQDTDSRRVGTSRAVQVEPSTDNTAAAGATNCHSREPSIGWKRSREGLNRQDTLVSEELVGPEARHQAMQGDRSETCARDVHGQTLPGPSTKLAKHKASDVSGGKTLSGSCFQETCQPAKCEPPSTDDDDDARRQQQQQVSASAGVGASTDQQCVSGIQQVPPPRIVYVVVQQPPAGNPAVVPACNMDTSSYQQPAHHVGGQYHHWPQTMNTADAGRQLQAQQQQQRQGHGVQPQQGKVDVIHMDALAAQHNNHNDAAACRELADMLDQGPLDLSDWFSDFALTVDAEAVVNFAHAQGGLKPAVIESSVKTQKASVEGPFQRMDHSHHHDASHTNAHIMQQQQQQNKSGKEPVKGSGNNASKQGCKASSKSKQPAAGNANSAAAGPQGIHACAPKPKVNMAAAKAAALLSQKASTLADGVAALLQGAPGMATAPAGAANTKPGAAASKTSSHKKSGGNNKKASAKGNHTKGAQSATEGLSSDGGADAQHAPHILSGVDKETANPSRKECAQQEQQHVLDMLDAEHGDSLQCLDLGQAHSLFSAPPACAADAHHGDASVQPAAHDDKLHDTASMPATFCKAVMKEGGNQSKQSGRQPEAKERPMSGKGSKAKSGLSQQAHDAFQPQQQQGQQGEAAGVAEERVTTTTCQVSHPGCGHDAKAGAAPVDWVITTRSRARRQKTSDSGAVDAGTGDHDAAHNRSLQQTHT